MADKTIGDLTAASLPLSGFIEIEQGGNSRKADVADLGAWTTVSTLTISGSPSTIVFDDLDCDELMLLFDAVTPSTSQAMAIEISEDGTDWDSLGSFSAANTNPVSGGIWLTGLKSGKVFGNGGFSSVSLPSFATTLRIPVAVAGGQIVAVRLSWGGNSAASGTIIERQR